MILFFCFRKFRFLSHLFTLHLLFSFFFCSSINCICYIFTKRTSVEWRNVHNAVYWPDSKTIWLVNILHLSLYLHCWYHLCLVFPSPDHAICIRVCVHCPTFPVHTLSLTFSELYNKQWFWQWVVQQTVILTVSCTDCSCMCRVVGQWTHTRLYLL